MANVAKKSGLILTGALVRGFAKVRHGKKGRKYLKPAEVHQLANRIMKTAKQKAA